MGSNIQPTTLRASRQASRQTDRQMDLQTDQQTDRRVGQRTNLQAAARATSQAAQRAKQQACQRQTKAPRTLPGRDLPTPDWLADARFYEIYPQSFQDSNGDGIGDIPGIIERLDYVADLGCNALWINPCFDSPFKDAGYDVRDYTKVAPRYGTNEDLTRLFDEAHRRGMHVLLDLVPGHTSEEHEWFRASAQVEPNDYSDRYIWTDNVFEGGNGMPFISGESDRNGAYILNFFKCQPALNYGFARSDRAWQQPVDAPGPRATRDALVSVMLFWLARGCDGFRVDMADSLVKNDDGKQATIALWHGMLEEIKTAFPQSAFVSEWGRPDESLRAGFDMDFTLDWAWDGGNGYHKLTRNAPDLTVPSADDASYFAADGGTGVQPFLDEYLPRYERTHDKGYVSFITCNHDTPRLAPRLTVRELMVAYGMLLTMPGVPFVYYGDEIGMRYRSVPTKEGGYARTGSRTPMQWDDGRNDRNMGFSTADPNRLYLPVDPASDAPSVAAQTDDPDSLLNWVKTLLHCRAEHPALRADAAFRVLASSERNRLFVYERSAGETRPAGEQRFADGERPAGERSSDDGATVADMTNAGAAEKAATAAERLIVVVNPGKAVERYDWPGETLGETETPGANPGGPQADIASPELLCVCGNVSANGDAVTAGPQSVAVFAVR